MATPKDKKGARGKTGGRKAGTPNKTTTALKDAIMNAFDKAGGEKYLIKIAKKNPAIFCSLLAKILPSAMTHSGPDGKPIQTITTEMSAEEAAKLYAQEILEQES